MFILKPMGCNDIQTPHEEQPEPICLGILHFLTPVEDFLEAPSDPRFCSPPPSTRARSILIRMCAEGRAERCRHQQPPQDGQVGRAWQAPGGNFGQIQEETSPMHIFPLTWPPCHAPLPGLHKMMASKNFLTEAPNVYPYAYAWQWYTNTSWRAA